jgi:hypothetical protein
MTTPLIPQEIYLLERYASLDYFGRMRDEFAGCVKAAEEALATFMTKLPRDYRARPLYEQPDAVWGERIIPNLQWALQGLNNGYTALSHGNADALGLAGNVTTSFSSIQRDYRNDWMPEPFRKAYDSHEDHSGEMASNIFHTQQGNWQMHSLTARYKEATRGPLNAPTSWPRHRLNPAVRVKTDAKVPRNGVYLPDASSSCAQYLIEGYEAWDCSVLTNPADIKDRRDTRVPTTWTLVERIAGSGGGVPGAADPHVAGVRLRAAAGETCPREGYWFTPARLNSRRAFRAGEQMPDVGGDYGITIWQWDEMQA